MTARSTYAKQRERNLDRLRTISAAGREIGDIPPVKDSARKQRAMTDFRFFCESYFPARFPLAWSDDHFKAIAKIEAATIRGGKFAFAMPRGFGKTTFCEIACLWAVVTGTHRWVLFIGSIEKHVLRTIRNIKRELATNPRLLDDFPEVVFPIVCLENESRRCLGQTHHGKSTNIAWKDDAVRLPTIPGSRASASIIEAVSLTGAIRGAVESMPDGSSIRPSLVILDDPQTDESARSPSQCRTREEIISGAVLNLAGPGVKISAIMPCTVIRENDLSDTILNREIHPEWQGERTKLVYDWPTDATLWSEYAKRRRDGLGAGDEGRAGTEFYRENRQAMDVGARVSWPPRYYPDELSAIQHAWNLRIDLKDPAFFAEYQNEPLRDAGPQEELNAADVVARVNGFARGLIPGDATILTQFVDVQKKALYYVVVAWRQDFTGYVVDYGTEPDQKSPYFQLRDIRRTLAMAAPKTAMSGAILAGLERLTAATIGREWRRDDGAILRIDRCLIDAKWGESTPIIDRFCRTTPYASTVRPYQGKYVGASSIPFSDYKRKPRDQVGLNWRIPEPSGRREVRYVSADSNYWKSQIYERFGVAMGDPGALSLFGRDPDRHRLLAEHVTAEYRVRTQAEARGTAGRVVDEWKLHPNRDNHWFDCLAGCAVAASMCGATVFGTAGVVKRKRVSLAEMQARGRGLR